MYRGRRKKSRWWCVGAGSDSFVYQSTRPIVYRGRKEENRVASNNPEVSVRVILWGNKSKASKGEREMREGGWVREYSVNGNIWSLGD